MTLITGFLISLSHERRYSFLWSKQSSVLAAYVFFSSRHTTNSSFVLLSVVDLFRLENVEKFFVLSFPHKSHEGNWIATEADKKKSIGGHDIWASYTGKYRLINRPVSKRIEKTKRFFPFSVQLFMILLFSCLERGKSLQRSWNKFENDPSCFVRGGVQFTPKWTKSAINSGGRFEIIALRVK